MSFWEAVALVGTMATILGVFITIYGLINNRVLKEEAAGIREMLDRMDRRHEEGRQAASEARGELAEILKRLGELVVSEGEKTREAARAKA